MQYNINIDMCSVMRWELNMAQAVVFAYIHGAASWATRCKTDPDYFNVSNGKLADELSPLSDKRDTMLRHILKLVDKGLLKRKSVNKKQFLMITDQGLAWNRERDICGTNIPDRELSGKNVPEEREEHPEDAGNSSVGSVNQISVNQNQITGPIYFPKILKEKYGYPDSQLIRNADMLKNWMDSDVTEAEFKTAYDIGVNNLNSHHPALKYLDSTIRNKRSESTTIAAKPKPTRQIESTDVLDNPAAQARYQQQSDDKIAKQIADGRAQLEARQRQQATAQTGAKIEKTS